jgi:HD superfamily phosphodiesterase
VLKIWGKNDSLVTSLTGQLHSEIPRIQRHKGELEILADEVFLGKGIEAVDCVTEGTCRADVFPCQSCKACAERRNRSVDGLDENTFAMKLRREQKSKSATGGRTTVVVA